MGQAKRRGNFEQRRAQAIERAAEERRKAEANPRRRRRSILPAVLAATAIMLPPR